ncbi:MAG: hypothetical protein HYY02_09700 [Chloroflexi bacterium]|nr:hypothetical protein [Chloroflexota bacterium]
MSSIRELKRLQAIDSEVAAHHQRLEEIQRQLEDTAALVELREQVTAARHRLTELERQQRSAEWEVESTRDFLKQVEAKLYGGRVNNPKELVSLQEEATMVKARAQHQEDAVLEVMTQLEGQQTERVTLERELEEAEGRRSELVDRLEAERQERGASMDRLTEQRRAIASVVPPPDLRLYALLLATKQGRAVARMERATCQGCRINLPMMVQQRVRSDQELVQCPSCGRVLYAD